MKTYKHIKIIVAFIIIFILLFTSSCYTKAFSLKNVITGGDDFIEDGKKGETPISDGSYKESLTDPLYNILLLIGIAIAVIVGVVLAIQFMVGSVEEKSKIKESLIPYFVGCAVVFGAFGIWKFVINILNGVL